MVESRASSTTMASPTVKACVFAVAVAFGAFDLGSYWFFKRASVDFIVARREADPPPYRISTTVSWKQSSPGALFGWSRPETVGTWSVGPSSALAVRLPGRPAEDLLLTASVIAFVNQHKLPARHVDVLVNGTLVAEWLFENNQPVERTARIARALIPGNGTVRVDFRFREVHSPSELGMGRDSRRMSLLMSQWRLDPVAGE